MNSLQRKTPGTAGTVHRGGYQSTNQHSNNTASADPLSSFINAMQDAGLTPTNPSEIIGDDTLHRFHVEGDRRGDKNGWCVLHLDAWPAGQFGTWKNERRYRWRANRHIPVSQVDREAIAEARREREAQWDRNRMAAAHRALMLWNESVRPDPAHPYLIVKRVNPHKARQYHGQLVLPLFDFDATLHSLQFIGPDGGKKLLRNGRKQGCFIPVAGRMPASRVLICEGWATGATLAESEPDALVLAAVDAYNLEAVAVGARRKWPKVEIVICGDCDAVGEERARIAAKAAGALIALPHFADGVEGTDFNDLANVSGVAA